MEICTNIRPQSKILPNIQPGWNFEPICKSQIQKFKISDGVIDNACDHPFRSLCISEISVNLCFIGIFQKIVNLKTKIIPNFLKFSKTFDIFKNFLKVSQFLSTHDSGGDLALYMCVCLSVCPSVTLLVKVY